ncbi:uncharacterized protein BO80DRAFT_82966 [Aspergillus ibericus CBS 121593]|uniref:Secreted protein n=1 Tax=Aspergillus ibericus CBS 121593 TaxID=1448316 RepID=A0A395HDE9_9EURO|nr:hypothetical protein BO80DRAFT_82966 [Aspergillus ibericus CBS 121593]RAL05862.1 hypothetical protein BO80DRAFT_82966 [Aspergillus ibericus CBS 121593]
MWSDLLISLLLVIPVYNREHSGRHCMDIIECVVFLLRPLHQIPFLFSGGHAEIRLNDACRAGVPAFRVQKSAFYDFSLLGARQLHRPCLANRFLTVSVSHGGLSLFLFIFHPCFCFVLRLRTCFLLRAVSLFFGWGWYLWAGHWHRAEEASRSQGNHAFRHGARFLRRALVSMHGIKERWCTKWEWG